jgi:hypothetical protein
MSTAYSTSWFDYFRADAEADEAIALYRELRADDPNSVATARAYDAAIMALRKSFAAQDVAEAITVGEDSDELEAAFVNSSRRAAEIKQEAAREVLRRARLMETSKTGGSP